MTLPIDVRRILVVVAHPDDAEFGCGGSVARWVAEGREVSYCILTSGNRGSDAIVAAQRALHKVGLRHKLKSYPANLSGGEQQRVAVARSLVGSPSVILADEPTAALDSENGVAVMSLLSQIAKDRSRAVLAVTHDPRTVPYADRILRIEDGLIVGEERRAEGVETVHELARTRKRKANA